MPGRVRLAVLPTPLIAAPRLAEALGAGSLLIKRDDLTGFAFGGNKARPLEFLVAAAVSDGADTLVTGGAPGSNFCAATAAAAQQAGLRCRLLIAGKPAPAGPALALAQAWGATVEWTGSTDRASVDAALPRAAAGLAARGHRPYVIPRGGATALGAVGYALAAAELREQLSDRGIGRARIVVAVGSGGTLAGLVAGNVLLGRVWTLMGGSVSRPPAAAAQQVLSLARGCLRLLTGTSGGITAGDAGITDVRGPGHSLPSAEGTAAAGQAMRTEGLMLDPLYTAKALTLAAGPPGPRPARAGGEPVVFWHTGGILNAVAAVAEAHAEAQP